MKWIGQNIWNFISRFRSDVYLENIADHGSDPDRFLTMNSSTGKVSYRTGTEVFSDIGAASGDITGVTLTADDTNTASDTAGSADFTIAGGEGVDTSVSGTTVTIAGEDASTSNKGVARFNSNHFAASSGAISLATAMTWADTVITTDSLTLTSSTADKPTFILKDTTNDNQATVLRMEKDSGAGTNGDNVGEIEFHSKDASDNTQMFAKILVEIDEATHGQESGAMELRVASHDGEQQPGLKITGGSVEDEVDVVLGTGTASVTTVAGDLTVTGSDLTFDSVALTAIQTSAESFVDNDTSIMTSAAIEDKIDATNVIMLSAGNGYLSTITADEWYFGNNSYGHSYHNWNNVKASITADAGTFTMSEDYNLVGRLVPIALSKVTLQVSARPSGGTSTDEVLSVCIVSADRDGAGTNTTWTVLAQGTITQVQGEYDGVDITYTGSIATSKMLAVGVGSTESGSIGTTNVRFNYALTGYIA